MPQKSSSFKVGVYIDVANIYNNGGQRMQYDVLREFACRDMAEPVRLNAYVTYDSYRADRDEDYRKGSANFILPCATWVIKSLSKKFAGMKMNPATATARPMPTWTWRSTPCCNPKTWTGC
jgi:hypothetical protein